MRLVLIRHGHDLPSDTGESSLSIQGRKTARTTAKALLSSGFDAFEVALCSPTLRATQTLDEIGSIIPFERTVISNALNPGHSSLDLDSLLLDYPYHSSLRFLVVGHEPQLSNAVLRWSGFPENDADDGTRPWVLSRGEGMVVRPTPEETSFLLHAIPASVNGGDRHYPRQVIARSAGVFN